MPERLRTVKSYALRAGRMSAAQRRSYDGLQDAFCLRPCPQSVLGPQDFALIFCNPRPVVAEIGFGMGIATAMIAQANRDTNYLGIEVHRPGIGKLLWEIESRGLSNIRIIEGDAAEVFKRSLADESLAGVHIFFPDPWPKKRHHKRRLVTRPFTETLAAKIIPGGYLYMVTDWAEYGDWAMAELNCSGTLTNPYGNLPGGFAPPREWRPRTRFEEKGLAAHHKIREIYFVKKG